MDQARFLMVGNGGLGSRIGEMATRMGLEGHYVDHDLVDLSNLNRQAFSVEDVGLPKPHCLVRALEKIVPRSMRLKGYWMTFQDFARTYGRRSDYSVVCCGVDNEEANIAVSRFAAQVSCPVVFVNVSGDGDACRVFVQRPGGACFVCYKPQSLESQAVEVPEGCPATPAIADILSFANGLALRAVVSEILKVPMAEYNCRDISFSGIDVKRFVGRRANCPICARASEG